MRQNKVARRTVLPRGHMESWSKRMFARGIVGLVQNSLVYDGIGRCIQAHALEPLEPVSYTHLTLPTILLV
eukprot:2082509-Amphidinium_carterae.1